MADRPDPPRRFRHTSRKNMKKQVKKAIFPVGGLGTRFLPATKAMPKEMLPVVDKPLIQYAVEEVAAAGIEEFIFVTGRGKDSIEDHFDVSYELDQTLAERGKTARSEEHTSELQSLMRISYAVFCLQNKKTTKT